MTASLSIEDLARAETLTDISTDDLRRLNATALEEMGNFLLSSDAFGILCNFSDRAEAELKRRGVTF